MDYDLKTLPAPTKGVIPYPPPNYLPAEDDTPETAIALSARGNYEKNLSANQSDKEAYDKDIASEAISRGLQEESLRTGTPHDVLMNAPRGEIIKGAVGDKVGSIEPVGEVPEYLDKAIGTMTQGPQEVIPQKAVTPFKEIEEQGSLGDEDTPEWAKAQSELKGVTSEVKSAIKEISPTAFKIVDGKKFISKKFVDENKESLSKIASSFGFESSKEVLEALLNHKDVKTGVGKTEFKGGKEYAGAKMTELPTAKIEGDSLILPDEWEEEHLTKAEEIAKKYGMKSNEFFAFIEHETGGTFSPKVVNNIGATGLVQFTGESAFDTLQLQKRSQEMESIRQSEGKISPKQQMGINKKYPFKRELPTEEARQKAWEESQYLVANMSLDEQLDLVDTYLGHATRGKKGLESVYSTVFAGSPDKKSVKMSKGNESLDINGDGSISREEFTAPVREKLIYNDVKVGGYYEGAI